MLLLEVRRMVVHVANGDVDIAQGAEQAIVGLARAWRMVDKKPCVITPKKVISMRVNILQRFMHERK